MRVRVLYHDHCFDGAASAAYFSRFVEEKFYPEAELVYTGKDIGAERARAIGLVNDVYPDAAAVQAAARELAREMAANSPLAVQGSKAVLRAGEGRTVEEGLDHVALWNASYLRSNDLAEAVTAFLEKRPPVFRGE